MQSVAAKRKNVGGRPAGPVKCSRCRKKSMTCGQLCAGWPGPASLSVVQQADATAADIIATVATAAVPTRRVSARGNVHRKAYPEGPELRDRATGKRHHMGGGVEGGVEEVEEEEEEGVEGGEGTVEGARALLQLGGARRRAPPPLPRQEGLPTAGTLGDGSVFVTESSLGEHAGLGLYAGRSFTKGQLITSYAGPLFYPEQLEDRDPSCADCF